MVFKAFDKDTASSDFLGETDPIYLIDYLGSEDEKHVELDIINGSNVGTLQLSMQLIRIKPLPMLNQSLNYNC